MIEGLGSLSSVSDLRWEMARKLGQTNYYLCAPFGDLLVFILLDTLECGIACLGALVTRSGAKEIRAGE